MLAWLAVHNLDEDGYEMYKGLIRHQGHLWIGANTVLSIKLLSTLHDSTVHGHSGTMATYSHVKKLFKWTGLNMNVGNYVC